MLEYHHFNDTPFRSPGGVHIHMFASVTLRFADGILIKLDDVFEISAPDFGLPLANPLRIDDSAVAEIQAL